MLMAMSKSKAMVNLVRQFTQLGATRVQTLASSYSTFTQTQMSDTSNVGEVAFLGGQCNNQPMYHDSGKDAASVHKHQIGENVSRKDKINFLVTTVVKWMLSKGQGTTMGTYGQLIRALDMDHRAEEAHEFWVKKIGTDLHSVPWHLCHRMISVYYRNNMLENLVKLFKGLEAFDRKPQDKLVVKKVADAYEMLGLLEEKERIFEKYDYLFTETAAGKPKKSKKFLSEKKKSGRRKPTSTRVDLTLADGIQAE
ncbi:pentatricopeptide repeat-containing protein At4g18975, chloroplastic isoform X4 [Vitis riparia]|uniref:pentatricopeptide repeat-containing protein At4g18975, chloroplastic isoform X4 n=1 Tax=Vitis riparia TaxID=96939 RepID=UPI00155AD19A|nr:pentatricopeptide repeat-containing protein At4g18975, chloroplastic isoform X4 [Vitis riparia]